MKCARCGRELNKLKVVWLELSMSMGTYHLKNELAQDDSQGLFPFGRDCALREIETEAKEK